MKKTTVFILLPLFLLFVLFAVYKYYAGDMGKNDFIWTPRTVDRKKNQYTILTANVGNSDIDCTSHKWKLCKKGIEQRIAKNIQIINADIITLQEVMPPWQCEQTNEQDPKKVCSEIQDPPQIKRLLGDDYTIVCNPNSQYDCFAIRKDVGEIQGCPQGGLCYSARNVEIDQDCDPGFSISAITVQLDNGAVFDVVNSHPASMSSSCRARMLSRAFSGDENHQSIIQSEHVLIMGDFNLDPWREDDESVLAWKDIFKKGWHDKEYMYHSGVAEVDPPRYTFVFVVSRSLDFVVSNFANGTLDVLGETPGTPRLDGGSGNDHRAVYGVLEIPPK